MISWRFSAKPCKDQVDPLLYFDCWIKRQSFVNLKPFLTGASWRVNKVNDQQRSRQTTTSICCCESSIFLEWRKNSVFLTSEYCTDTRYNYCETSIHQNFVLGCQRPRRETWLLRRTTQNFREEWQICGETGLEFAFRRCHHSRSTKVSWLSWQQRSWSIACTKEQSECSKFIAEFFFFFIFQTLISFRNITTTNCRMKCKWYSALYQSILPSTGYNAFPTLSRTVSMHSKSIPMKMPSKSTTTRHFVTPSRSISIARPTTVCGRTSWAKNQPIVRDECRKIFDRGTMIVDCHRIRL